jgi:uncharacterized protein DUF6132
MLLIKVEKKLNLKELFSNRWIKMSLFVVLGAIGGYSYYYFIGCSGGGCPITSNPYISSGYGMAVGLLLSFDSKKKREKTEDTLGE